MKLSRHKLAQTVNISDKFLYDIEMGKKGMSARTLLRLAEALNVSAGWLLAEKRSRRRK
ncbi:MAG: helix-turn-helix domain-containing protein [Oscillospiraceae bacterium]|nr:helix-turn-helix domain-containing protein [Oscillospiraceae bacterium]